MTPVKNNENKFFYNTKTNKTNVTNRKRYNRYTNKTPVGKYDKKKDDQYCLTEMNFSQFYKSPEICQRSDKSLIYSDKKRIITNRDLRNAKLKTIDVNSYKNNHNRFKSIDCDSNKSSLYEAKLRKNNNFGYRNNYGKIEFGNNKNKNIGRNIKYH